MKNIFTTVIVLMLIVSGIQAQGIETFSNNENTGTSYATSISWTGDNGQTWTATNARSDQEINGKAVCMKNGKITGNLTNAQQAAGVGMVSFKYSIPFSDAKIKITLSVTVGGTSVNAVNAATLEKGKVYEVSNFPVNAPSGTTIILENTTSARVTIDDLEWTAYSGGTQPDPGTLTAPMAAAATNVSTNGFTANWSAVQNATSYSLSVWQAGNDQEIDASPYNTSATNYTVTGLASNTTYYYNTTASASGYTTSQPSNTISVTTTGNAAVNPYYTSADGRAGTDLIKALQSIITNGHQVVSYDGLWTAFRQTDNTANGRVWDMYSNCTFTWGSDQCGNYRDECDCYNREHSVPKSWFNDAKPMYSDIVHLIPTDGKVNGMRSNYPFGEVGNATYTSDNGSKLGSSNFSGYSGKVFEPADEYKGDFARIYFYMVTRYRNINFTQEEGGRAMFTYSSGTAGLTTYATNLLLKWHREDPVSEKEKDRNDGIEDVQGNRNPFVDYPELAEYIWGTNKGETWHMSGTGIVTSIANNREILSQITISNGRISLATDTDETVAYTIYGIDGKRMLQGSFRGQAKILTNRFGQGLYLLQTRAGGHCDVHKLLIP